MSITLRRVLGGTALGLGGLGGVNLYMRYKDRIKGDDPFSRHTNIQQSKHWFSGNHDPYIPNESQWGFINKHFSQFKNLIPLSLEEIQRAYSLKSPVQLKRLADLPKNITKIERCEIVAGGGPPAVVPHSNVKGVTYINDGRRAPICEKSAAHIEPDGPSEAPTSTQPLHFMIAQIKKLIFPEFLATVEKTGDFSWKSIDWVSWIKMIKNPSKLAVGIRIFLAYQRFTQSGLHPEVVEEVASRAKRNERFYKALNKEIELFMAGEGSVYVARTESEKEELIDMQKDLQKEDREMPFLSNEDLLKEFGFIPEGKLFGKKMHDRTIHLDFLKRISDRIVQNGGKVINGRITTVYTDDPDQGGILEYRRNDDDTVHYIDFQKLVMSLGTQEVRGVDGVPLFDTVAAKGVSTLALLHLPKGAKLPPAVVCGGVNHVTKLAGPVSYRGKDVYFVRGTTGANISATSDSPSYYAVAAIGFKKAVSEVLNAKVEIVSAVGCPRQFAKGQLHWIQVPKTLKTASRGLTPRGDKEDIGSSLPKKISGIFLQFGAGGGGVTQAASE